MTTLYTRVNRNLECIIASKPKEIEERATLLTAEYLKKGIIDRNSAELFYNSLINEQYKDNCIPLVLRYKSSKEPIATISVYMKTGNEKIPIEEYQNGEILNKIIKEFEERGVKSRPYGEIGRFASKTKNIDAVRTLFENIALII